MVTLDAISNTTEMETPDLRGGMLPPYLAGVTSQMRRLLVAIDFNALCAAVTASKHPHNLEAAVTFAHLQGKARVGEDIGLCASCCV